MALSFSMRPSGNHNLIQLTPAGDNTTKMAADGSHVAFSTRDQLSPGDTDTLFDTYDWHNGITEQASVDENGQNHNWAVRVEGHLRGRQAHRLRRHARPAGGGGHGQQFDVYERFAGATRLASKGPFPAPSAPRSIGMSEDGARIFFRTRADA